MSNLILSDDETGHQHKICVGKRCAWCMDCGQILLEYKRKKDFYKLMNPIPEVE